MSSKTQLIFACDIGQLDLGLAIIDKVANEVDFVKVGLEAMTAEDGEGKTLAYAFRRHTIVRHARSVMWDMKLHDVANTVRNASRNIVKGSRLFTLHATASDEALAAAAEEAGNKSIALAVTVLTDLDESQCSLRFLDSSKSAVVRFARNAWLHGIRGFVCSPLEAADIRDALPDAYIVTPGIRPLWSVGVDEQKRVTTPTMAAQADVNAIVVGRPIYNPPPCHTEASAARAIREELNAA